MGRLRTLILLVIGAGVLVLSGYQPAPAAIPTHEVYIWQRAWHTALGEAMVQAADLAQRWRVLAGHVGPDGRLHAVAVDAAMLKAAPRPTWMVLRFDGQFPVLDDPALAPQIIRQILGLAVSRAKCNTSGPWGIDAKNV